MHEGIESFFKDDINTHEAKSLYVGGFVFAYFIRQYINLAVLLC